jgi:dTDP-4-dehydrorhamnose reductase
VTLELWAGLECTVNRVGSFYFDQIKRTGHETRSSDLAAIAELGIRKLRYPVLWERTEDIDGPNWSWSDERLGLLRTLNVDPIVGLLHHGSGPAHTSIVDPAFPAKFAAYARSVAERYPWITNYVPVNEPLTTGRFSCLYGHWYPHEQSDYSFANSIVNQCKATVLAMREIRRVNSEARLIQTEDIGRRFASERLQYQADFENERRWLSFDLLAGRVDREHPMWPYMRCAGCTEEELCWFQRNACPPDVLGLNYYVTSDRYLDEHLERFPSATHGGNGRHLYADVEAIRVEGIAGWGIEARLREAWERYRCPMAITEVHLGCADEFERVAWLREIWTAAETVRSTGADILGVTAWAVLGSYDWHNLVTRKDDVYEAGVFDVSDGCLAPTLLRDVLADLGRGRPAFVQFAQTGWWRRSGCICYEAAPAHLPGCGSVPVAGTALPNAQF